MVCGSNHIQKRGWQCGKQRFRCADCGFSFVLHNIAVKENNHFVWFRKWVMERWVYRYLVRDSGMSQSAIQKLFKSYLSSAPLVAIRVKGPAHILIDASYFSGGLCLILYYDHDIRYVQLYRHTDTEKYKEIKEDLENLKVLGVQLASVTCDGHKAILKAVRTVYPDALIQRCLVHLKRQARTWLSSKPKLPQAIALLAITPQITYIKTHEERTAWLYEFYLWHEENKDFVNEQTRSAETGRLWYTHKNLHAAASLIMIALPNMFHYLDNPAIPTTTNRLENYFAHLKDKLTLHRGLRFEAKKNFIKWYLHFKNNP